jgi:DNA-directed RNA polymerase specialized sigma24 family protein
MGRQLMAKHGLPSRTALTADQAPAAEPPCDKKALAADAKLAKRCVAGEVSAWEELYAQCHDPLCALIRGLLGSHADLNLVDEMAARVWYALVANDGELLARYSPKHGARLITFMRSLAKDEICRHFRTELRRRERELCALREKSPHQSNDLAQSVHAMSEFLAILTPRERGFCNAFLLADPSGATQACTPNNVWQLTHRIYHKLLRFIDHGE